jgi:hypothetical protein
MVNSIIIKEEVKDFPKLMINEDDMILLFHCQGKGIVISTGESINFKVGQYYNGWNCEEFTDYNKEIKLQNK